MRNKNFRVLVPVDFTETSRGAVTYVLRTFPPRLTHLHLLHAYKETTPGSAPMISLIDILRQKSERLMQQELERIYGLMGSNQLEIAGYSRFDALVPAILEICAQSQIDLVVVGSYGKDHLRPERYEEDPHYILQQTKIPLLLVPKIANS